MGRRSKTRRRRRRRRRKHSRKGGKRGGGNGSSSSSSSSAAGPGSWINELSTRESTLTPSQPSDQSTSTESSTGSDWFFQGQPRPGADLSGYGVGEDIQLLNGCEVANRSCAKDCVLPWKTGICTYDKEKRRIYCKCRGKTQSKKQSGGRRRHRRRKRRTRKRRGGWFGSNWFGTWGQEPKKTDRFIKGSWTSKGMSCNPYLPLQCPGGLKCRSLPVGVLDHLALVASVLCKNNKIEINRPFY